MPRMPKKGIYMNFKLENSIVEQLNRYSEETMIPKTRIVEKALSEFFENEDKKHGEKQRVTARS